VKWSNVAPNIQRHPRHDRVVARKIEVPRVRRCEESQGGLRNMPIKRPAVELACGKQIEAVALGDIELDKLERVRLRIRL
jgi:hypothetical protein